MGEAKRITIWSLIKKARGNIFAEVKVCDGGCREYTTSWEDYFQGEVSIGVLEDRPEVDDADDNG